MLMEAASFKVLFLSMNPNGTPNKFPLQNGNSLITSFFNSTRRSDSHCMHTTCQHTRVDYKKISYEKPQQILMFHIHIISNIEPSKI